MKYFKYQYIREQLISMGFNPEDVEDADLVEWIGSALMILENEEVWERVTTNGEDGNPPPIIIQNYRGNLPDDLIKLDLVINKSTGLALIEEPSVIPPMYVDNFFGNDKKTPDKYSLAYLGKSTQIIVSFKSGEVIIIYRRFILDEEGNLLIPSEQYIYRYALFHCASMLAKRYLIQGKLDYKVYDEYNREYLFYAAAVSNTSKNFTRGYAEAIKLRKNILKTSFRYPTRKR
jgi:hypothetical protein